MPNRAVRELLEAKEEEKSALTPSSPQAPVSPIAAVTPGVAPPAPTPFVAVVPPPLPSPKMATSGPAAGSITVPDTPFGELPGINLVCVLDTSGSMNAAATVTGGVESTDLSILNIVTHVTKAIAATLRPGIDSFGVVSYSSDAKVVHPVTPVLNDKSWEDVAAKLDTLDAGGMTNIYGALDTAVRELDEAKTLIGERAAADVVFLLTDGVANVEPPRGTCGATRRLLAQRRGRQTRPLVLHTFGFGNNQNERDLEEIAQCSSHGRYTLTYDSGMVCSTFANNIATVMTTHQRATEEHGRLMVAGGVYWPAKTKIEDRPRTEQSRVAFEALLHALIQSNMFSLNTTASGQLLQTCLNSGVLVSDDVKNLEQVRQAVSREDWWNDWGRRYLLSLVACITDQVGHNARDSACLRYGGDAYRHIVETMQDLFVTLPPPKPARVSHAPSYGSSSLSPSITRSIDMSAYNDMSGGCIDVNTTVATPLRGQVRLGDLERGDPIIGMRSGSGVATEPVVCRVLAIVVNRKQCPVFEIGGVRLTAYHPLWTSGKWRFPIDVVDREKVVAAQARVASILVDDESVQGVFIGDSGMLGAVLGHGSCQGSVDPVLGHAYYGDRKRVLPDVMALPEIAPGAARLLTTTLRHAQTGQVVGML